MLLESRQSPSKSPCSHLIYVDQTVYFHCGSSSEGGRGSRTAGWYQDALDQLLDGKDQKAVILAVGIKRWLKLHGEDESVTTRRDLEPTMGRGVLVGGVGGGRNAVV